MLERMLSFAHIKTEKKIFTHENGIKCKLCEVCFSTGFIVRMKNGENKKKEEKLKLFQWQV